MSEDINVIKILKKIINEDLRTIITFLVFLLILVYGFAALMGYLALGSTSFRTPSISLYDRAHLADTDKDSLPDVIEGFPGAPCKRGDPVFNSAGEHIGTCTGTDYKDIDTDNDGFTDAIEDALGTNPLSPWNPGWIYIVMAAYLFVFIFNNYYRGDPLKEYKEFEQRASEGVTGKEGKFAYGGSSVFGNKKAEEASEEERRAAIQQDVRFQRMTMEGSPEKPEVVKKRNYTALIIQFSIAALIGIFIFIAARQS